MTSKLSSKLRGWKSRSQDVSRQERGVTVAAAARDSAVIGFPRENCFPRAASTWASVPSAARLTRRATCPTGHNLHSTHHPRKLSETCHHRSRWIIDAVLFARRRGGDAVEGGGEAATGARWVITKQTRRDTGWFKFSCQFAEKTNPDCNSKEVRILKTN